MVNCTEQDTIVKNWESAFVTVQHHTPGIQASTSTRSAHILVSAQQIFLREDLADHDMAEMTTAGAQVIALVDWEHQRQPRLLDLGANVVERTPNGLHLVGRGQTIGLLRLGHGAPISRQIGRLDEHVTNANCLFGLGGIHSSSRLVVVVVYSGLCL